MLTVSIYKVRQVLHLFTTVVCYLYNHGDIVNGSLPFSNIFSKESTEVNEYSLYPDFVVTPKDLKSHIQS